MSRAGNIAIAIVAIIFALVVLLCGACFGVFGFMALSQTTNRSTGALMLLLAVILIGVAVAAFAKVVLPRLRGPKETPPNA